LGIFRKDKPIPVAIAQDTAMQQTPLVTTIVPNKPITTTSYSTSYMYPVQQPTGQYYPIYNPAPIPPDDGGGGGYIPPQPQPIPPNGGGGGYIPPQPGPPGPIPDPCSSEEFQRQVENDPQINQIVDQIVASIPPNACGVRPPTRRREERVIQSNCPPRTAVIRRRLQSPEPDIIERHTVVRGQNDTVNIIIEKPGMPAPCIIEETEEASLAPPRITHRVVCVPAGPPQCPPGSGGGNGGGGGAYPPAQPDYGPGGGRGYIPPTPYQPSGGGDAGNWYPSSQQPGGQYYPYQPSSTRYYPSSTQRYQLGQQFPSFSQQYSSQPMYSSYTQQYQRYPSSSKYMRSYQPQQQQSYQKQYNVPYQQQRSYSPQQQQGYQQQRISTSSSPTSLFSPISRPQPSYNWPQTQIQSSQF